MNTTKRLLFISIISILTVGCFDDTSKNETSDSDSGAKDPASSPAFAEKDVTVDKVEPVSGEDAISAGFLNAAKEESTPESFVQFMNNEIPIGVPTTSPDKDGVNQKAMNSKGKVILKPSKFAMYDIPDVTRESRKVECSKAPTSYYCTDEFMRAVQSSKNRITLPNGGEVVLTQAISSGLSDYIITYVKNNTVYTTSLYMTKSFGLANEYPLKYARVNGDACFYGQVYDLDEPQEVYYTCLKEMPDGLGASDTNDLIFAQQTYDQIFTDTEFGNITKSNYGSFYNTSF